MRGGQAPQDCGHTNLITTLVVEGETHTSFHANTARTVGGYNLVDYF